MNGNSTTKRSRAVSNRFLIVLGILLLVWFVAPRIFDRINYLVERNRIYTESLRRVERAGGWQTIENASLAFAKGIPSKPYFRQHYYWGGRRITTNELPATLDTLQPFTIDFEPDAHGIPVLRIKLFGIHRTGLYDQPYYGIWVICTNVPATYTLQFSGEWAGRRGIIERKGDLIFEAR